MKDIKLMTNAELKSEYEATLQCYYHYGYICIHWACEAMEKEMQHRGIKY